MEQNILLVSGGNDSICIYNKYDSKLKFNLIYFNYGQKYMKEELKRLPDNTEVITMKNLQIDTNGYVKGRNLLFLIEIAKRFDNATIYMGSNKEDTFPDNNYKYLTTAIKVINISFNTNLKIVLPLRNKTKTYIMNYINNYNLNTYSCYKGGKTPCNKCKACLSIKNAT